MKVFSRLAVVSAVMVGLAAFAAPVHAGDTRTPAPLWRRELPALTADLRFKPVLRPLAGGTLLVRNGAGVAALDARGRTLWSEPDIDGFIADGAMVVFRRSGVVFAMRRRDAGVLWRRPCSKPNYLVAAGDRVLTICGGRSTVLGARTGGILSQRTPRAGLAQPPFRSARPLNEDYVLVMNVFDGAWLGEYYSVVDAHSGAFLWGTTDTDFFDVTKTTVSITPYPGMLPWAETGSVERRRLSDGKVLGKDRYPPPAAGDANGRGRLTFSNAAAYVNTTMPAAYRFPRGSRTARHLGVPGVREILVLGSSGFVIAQENLTRSGTVSLDRPSGSGFSLRPIGDHSGWFTAPAALDGNNGPNAGDVLRLDDRIVVSDKDRMLRVYDETGSVEIAVRAGCPNPLVALGLSALYVECPTPRGTESLTAFARPRAGRPR